jgi:general stress protein 26
MKSTAGERSASPAFAPNPILELEQAIRRVRPARLVRRRSDSSLVCTPAAIDPRTDASGVWLVAAYDEELLTGLIQEPMVNVSFDVRDDTWLSLSGIARATRNRDLIARMWSASWRPVFAARDVDPAPTREDPRLILIHVDVRRAERISGSPPRATVLFERYHRTRGGPGGGPAANLELRPRRHW